MVALLLVGDIEDLAVRRFVDATEDRADVDALLPGELVGDAADAADARPLRKTERDPDVDLVLAPFADFGSVDADR